MPVHEEELAVERRPVERVPIGTLVCKAPPVRQEGDTLDIPLVEGGSVVERRLILREAVRVRRTQTPLPHTEHVTLRAEDVTVSRAPASSEPVSAGRSDTTAPAALSRSSQDNT
jgi:stress response protein YsnF